MSMRLVKGWVLPLVMAVLVVALADGYMLRIIYSASSTFPPVVGWVTLEFLPRLVRALVSALVGIGLIVACCYRLVQNSNGRLLRGHRGMNGSGARSER
jgi:hypothetical protein